MKKFLSILLSVVLIVCIFCSCSNSSDEKVTEKEEKDSIDLVMSYDSAYDSFDDSVISAYRNVCNAIINFESEIRVNTGMFDNIRQLLYTSFPLIDLVESVSKKEDNSGLNLKYKNNSDIHKKKINEFKVKINEIQKTCKKGTVTESEYAVNVYNYVASNIKESKDASITCYETIMTGEGTSFSYSNMFEYLLLQSEIPASHIIAEDAAGTGWGLSAAALGGKLYYFDVMSEYFANSGKQLVYFAMTSEDVKNEGLTSLKTTNQVDSAEATDDAFEPCRSCKSWKIENNILYVTRFDEKVVEIDLP